MENLAPDAPVAIEPPPLYLGWVGYAVEIGACRNTHRENRRASKSVEKLVSIRELNPSL